jgi:hypothetical protein
MRKRIVLLGLMAGIVLANICAQEKAEENFFRGHLNHRVYLGFYSSYFDDNIRLLQGGYDAVLGLINITPDFNLLDVGVGLGGMLAYDMVNELQEDNWGRGRPKNGRITFSFEVNWSLRVYVIPVPRIDSRIYMEGCGMSLVVYSREFPDTGTHVNIGTNLGLGIEYPVKNSRAYTTLRWFHTSNGKTYENNPALNTVGIIMGIQFK